MTEREGQPFWDMNDYERDFVWLGIPRTNLKRTTIWRLRWRYRYQRYVRCVIGRHVWARRRDGRACAYCERREYR